MNTGMTIEFPKPTGIRVLMMPYSQGDLNTLPDTVRPYFPILERVFLDRYTDGFLTIDESPVVSGQPHRGTRAKFGRALHTEVGRHLTWGGYTWGGKNNVTVDRDTEILLANSLNATCAVWDTEHVDTSLDGDIGHKAHLYPYSTATLMQAGEVHRIGVLTPHESLPIDKPVMRQFLRIVGAGVHGREPYFTENPRFP